MSVILRAMKRAMKCFVVFALSAKSHVPRVLPVVCVGVVSSAIVSRIKDLQQWESLFSAHTSYMNSCLSLDFAVRGVLEIWKMCP